MRICFVSRRYFPAISGMSVYAQNLLRELVAAGHDVTMISQYRGDELGTRVYGGGPPPPVPGVRVIGLEQLGEQAGGDFERDVDGMVAAISAEHARASFDILHAQYGYPTGWAVLLASQRLGVPNVVSIQGGDGHWVGSCCETHRLAMVRVLDHAGAVLIGGESFIDEVAGRLGTARERFQVVPGAVDTERFRPADEARVGEAASPVRILYHGRVDRRKGALDLVEALALLRERGLAIAATISGIGPDLDASRARAGELGLGELRFTGYADYETVPALYREADIFASPTYAEGFSNTVLEAMASGLAVASCRAVGILDCLRDGENALLTEPGDVAAHADALGRLATDHALRRRLARAALAECRATYAWDVVARAIMAVYADLAGRGPDIAFSPDLPLTPLPVPGGPAPPVSRPVALALSPHLDDAAFSCGGTLARLARTGWRVVVATLFTRSMPDPEGFALACQLDKGLGPEVDYMAVRRREDEAAAACLGAEPVWLPFAEAPHRGYGSAPALFGAPHAEDRIVPALAEAIGDLACGLAPALVLAPQAVGGHVDHIQAVRALDAAGLSAPVAWWRDFPYLAREPRPAEPFGERFAALPDRVVALAAGEADAKRRACLAYASQIGFQFGGPAGLDFKLAAAGPVERLRGATPS